MTDYRMSDDEIRKAKGLAGFLGALTEDFLLIVRMIESVMKGEYTLQIWELVKLIGAVAYVLLPLDVIPDFILGLGFSDDILVVKEVLESMANIITRFRMWEKRDQN